jgi:hypothetical protein
MLNSRQPTTCVRRKAATGYLITHLCNEAKQEHSRLMQIMAPPKRLRFTSLRTAKPPVDNRAARPFARLSRRIG